MKKLKWPARVVAFCIMPLATAANESALEQKIVALTPHSVEMLYAIGVGERIVGTVTYADYPAQAQKIQRIGQHDRINFEQLLLLEPDLIVLAENALAAPLVKQLKSLGIAMFNSSVSKIDEIPERLLQLGQVVGAPSQAKQKADEFRQELGALRQQYQHRDKISVFWQLNPEPLISSANTWQSQMIQDCGGRNVFDGATSNYPQVNMEQILVRQPQVIIRPYHNGIDLSQQNWQRWPEIPAVAQQQIYDIHGDLVHRPGPRVLQGLKALCEAIDKSRSFLAQQVNSQ